MPERGTRGSGTTAYYRGPDAYSQQRDVWDMQQRSEPRSDGWFFSTADSPQWNGQAATGRFTAIDTWYFLLMPILSRAMIVHELRLRVSTLAVGAHVDVAVFVCDPENPRIIRAVPHLYSEFDTTTTGVKTVQTEHDPDGAHAILHPGNRYFVGCRISSLVLRVLCISGGGAVVPIRSYPGASGRLHSVDMGKTSATSESVFPWIIFLSEIAAGIF